MESRRLCAYNQTRECFLGLEVAVADIAVFALKDMLGSLALRSGEGLWLAPFREIPETEMHLPLDLIYLDEDCRVIDVVESFPTFHVPPFTSQATSVLALPTHSIFSSQTQSGDQLVLCIADEMQRRLERLSSASGLSSVVQGAIVLRSKPLWSGGRGVVELENNVAKELSAPQPIYEIDLIKPGTKAVKPPKSWLERWWAPDPREAPDPRKAPRDKSPGLAAYYWNGSAPKGHMIRDISATGLYVVTEERWYPGTLILMILQETDSGPESVESAISVHSKAIRWGNDGVGLQFIPQDAPEAHTGINPLANGADRRVLDQFLQRLLKSKA